ncbi:MAG: hypothetical protein KF850_11770 [Labilithrix sp.]|nr:hypothetical protein [Labilithrix sp.]MBX3212704.1 hypothetical protein [Labilithrix sp.]
MRLAARLGWLVGAAVAACGGAPATPAAPAEHDDEHASIAEEEPFDASGITIATPERTRAPSTASYEEAISTPEPIDVHDDRIQLTDGQLTGPMRGVLSRCRVPSNAKVTIQTAVQDGRAIGVSVTVAFEHPKSAKRISNATRRYEAKTSARIVKCAQRAVRAVTWPPSRRRDSFTTVF